MKKINVGIFGATGYAGFELVGLLARHPHVEIVFATSQSFAGQTLDTVYAPAPPLQLVKGEDAPLEQVDVVFLCLPHAASAATAVRALEAGCRVIDLSADFRIRDVATYEQWYQVTHPAPEKLSAAVYGLTEHARSELREADIVACPGCYPTSILLPLQPLLTAGAVKGPIIADSKSGVSGAGRTPKQITHFVEVADNLTPYSLGQSHRHWVEMQQVMARWGNGSTPELVFSPHLIAIPRGILSTIYAPLVAGWDVAAVRDLYEVYAPEPFIHVLPEGRTATIAHVVRTNKCVIGLTAANGTLIITAAIDNLTKGASGQAVQNFNVMLGFEETTALM